jgi:hypothetical protein
MLAEQRVSFDETIPPHDPKLEGSRMEDVRILSIFYFAPYQLR